MQPQPFISSTTSIINQQWEKKTKIECSANSSARGDNIELVMVAMVQ